LRSAVHEPVGALRGGRHRGDVEARGVGSEDRGRAAQGVQLRITFSVQVLVTASYHVAALESAVSSEGSVAAWRPGVRRQLALLDELGEGLSIRPSFWMMSFDTSRTMVVAGCRGTWAIRCPSGRTQQQPSLTRSLLSHRSADAGATPRGDRRLFKRSSSLTAMRRTARPGPGSACSGRISPAPAGRAPARGRLEFSRSRARAGGGAQAPAARMGRQQGQASGSRGSRRGGGGPRCEQRRYLDPHAARSVIVAVSWTWQNPAELVTCPRLRGVCHA